jgi:hypothetical protein
MQYIKKLVWQNRKRIAAAAEPTAEITYVLYEHIRDYMLDVVDAKKKAHGGKIAILGGIQINVAHAHDWFEPKIFVIMDKNGTTDYTMDLLGFKSAVSSASTSISKRSTDP